MESSTTKYATATAVAPVLLYRLENVAMRYKESTVNFLAAACLAAVIAVKK